MRTAVAILLMALAPSAAAQSLAKKPVLSLEGAKAAAQAAENFARANRAAGAIAVVDDGGNLLLAVRLDGTFAAGANVSIGKARTAALFKRPTSFFEDVVNRGRTAMTALPDFTPLRGGVPIVVDGEIVGAIGVSGANSAQQDEEVAMAGAEALKSFKIAQAGTRLEPVTYVENRAVNAAFAKGAPLLENDRFKIHASRRDGPGQAEVHAKDTDIIYVVDGSATLVTGGTVVDGKTTAPDEVRGSALSGGEAHRLTKGDVLVVPAGTPHWFKDVPGPFTYYVVKAS